MQDQPPSKPRQSRIQIKNRETILAAALEIFSSYGFRGTTLDQIADKAGLSKPNLLYYFASKEEIYRSLLTSLLTRWLEPLHALRAEGDPLAEVLAYAERKLEMSRDYPRESRLFANEILQGAPQIQDAIRGDLRLLVQQKAQILQLWMDRGQITACDPVHLIFSIWSLTQHYADFDIQVRLVLGEERNALQEGAAFIEHLLRRLLQPAAQADQIENI